MHTSGLPFSTDPTDRRCQRSGFGFRATIMSLLFVSSKNTFNADQKMDINIQTYMQFKCQEFQILQVS